ncbi:MAG: GGDEF and EAL domain-containing protein [Clostridia bacterium]
MNSNKAMNINSFVDAKALYEALSKSTDNYLFICNMKSKTFYFCDEMKEKFSLPMGEITDIKTLLLDKVHPSEQSAVGNALEDIMAGRSCDFYEESRLKTKDGQWVWTRCRGRVEECENGEKIFAGSFTDMGKYRKIDAQTSLPNKFEFVKLLTKQLSMIQDKSQEENITGGIMMLGIDNFRHINSLYGHYFGDEVLRKVIRIIEDNILESVSLYKLDGDQFALISSSNTEKDFKEIYDNIFKAFQTQHELLGQKYYCTLSAGCALFEENITSSEEFYKRAEYALECAKSDGKNRLCIYKPGIMSNKIRALELTEILRTDIDNDFNNFEVYFQPIVNAENGKLKGSEALLRWHCEKYGIVGPAEFIPLLERSGLINKVGTWVLKKAVEVCVLWRNVVPSFFMCVNMSFQQLLQKDFIDILRDTLAPVKLEISAIKVELTESCIATSSRYLKETFDEIRALGAEIAMDDFGTGYSSLNILKSAPADIVKIDRAFVSNIVSSEFDLTFIKFVVALCHSVGIRVCLEGIETIEEYNKVKDLKLDFIQGFFFGHPSSKNIFENKFLH